MKHPATLKYEERSAVFRVRKNQIKEQLFLKAVAGAGTAKIPKGDPRVEENRIMSEQAGKAAVEWFNAQQLAGAIATDLKIYEDFKGQTGADGEPTPQARVYARQEPKLQPAVDAAKAECEKIGIPYVDFLDGD